MEKKEKRFVKTLGESSIAGASEIWVDTQTGVNYFFHAYSTSAAGLTPLLDRDGNPVVTPMGSIPDLD